MKIAIASGKGGTGKTMIATSLAAALAPHHNVQLLDCDVEAPNAHLFLQPTFDHTQPAVIPIPEIDPALCTLCGHCVSVCAFHALAMVGANILVFPQLCHGCGSCTLQCPENAISEKLYPIGEIRSGDTPHPMAFAMGELTTSEPMPTPIIRQLKSSHVSCADIQIYDAPPGASCAVVATVHDADYLLLVTEPTVFGLHDLRMMLGVLEHTHTPAGVIINRTGIGAAPIRQALEGRNIPVLMEIPYDAELASGLAAGKLLIDLRPAYRSQLSDLWEAISNQLQNQGALS